MKEILSTYGRWLAVSLSLASLVILILLLTAGQGRLFGALFVGYAAAAVCIVTPQDMRDLHRHVIGGAHRWAGCVPRGGARAAGGLWAGAGAMDTHRIPL